MRASFFPKPRVPFLPKAHIDREAEGLLREYGERFGEVTSPPIPIDEIIELHLGLTFEIRDLRELFEVGDVHGAIWIQEGRIAVDASLDPTVNPRRLGRYRFTLAHETGHWRLHREFFLRDERQRNLFDANEFPSLICRTSQRKEPVEWQADAFAARLLMPREMVFSEWVAWQKSPEPLYLEEVKATFEKCRSRFTRLELVSRAAERGGDNALGEILMEQMITPMANRFEVSGQAMRIRLEELGLIQDQRKPSLFD